MNQKLIPAKVRYTNSERENANSIAWVFEIPPLPIWAEGFYVS